MSSGSEQPSGESRAVAGDRPYVSFIIPCYNSVGVIGRSVGELRAYLEANRDWIPSAEIIVVDDGSTDGSGDAVERDFPDVTLIRHDVNRGKGAAVRTGMLAAHGSFRFFIDADLPYHLDALRPMLRYLDFKEFDVAIGTRAAGADLSRVKRTLLRRITSAVYTSFTSRIVVTGVRDTQCGFKGFRAAATEYLFRESRVDNFAFDVELLYLAYKNDMDIKRIPVSLVNDDYSTVSIFRHGPGMLFETLRLPLRYYTGRYRMMGAGDE